MKRHIKIKAELVNNHTRVLITVLDITVKGKRFGAWGTSGHYLHHTFLHGRIRLVNDDVPGAGSQVYRPSGDRAGEIWIIIEQIPDRDTLTIPIDLWPEVKEAIEVYNEWGAKQ